MLDESLEAARAPPAKADCSREISNSPAHTSSHRAEILRQPRHTVLGNEDAQRQKKLLNPLLICRTFPPHDEEQREAEFQSLTPSTLDNKPTHGFFSFPSLDD